MASLGDISDYMHSTTQDSSLAVAVPIWPNISLALPPVTATPPPGGSGTPSSVTFS